MSQRRGWPPKLVEQVGSLLGEIARRGAALLLVEQKLTIALNISQRLYVMGHGRIVFQGTPADFLAKDLVRQQWLEVVVGPHQSGTWDSRTVFCLIEHPRMLSRLR